MKDLIAALQQNGFDVWVVSASPQLVVERFAAKVNIAPDHVIGIRSVDDKGTLTYNLQGCGDVPDGANNGGGGSLPGNSLITYMEGKRCWINKVIYGDSGKTALDKTADPKMRQVFGAGDSTTDVTFLQDATALKLVLNRNKTELMCNAYRNAGDAWIVNPMFIGPKPQLMTPYPCSSGCVDKAGKEGLCLDENGEAIPDQMDTVF